MRFLALDLETGGLDPDKHQILQIGLALFEGGEPVSTREIVLQKHPKLGGNTTIGALEVTGIRVRDMKDGVTEAEAYAQCRSWIEEHDAAGLLVVSHNSEFDQKFWSQFVFRQGVWVGKWPNKTLNAAHPILTGPWACTRRMIADLNLPNQQLDTLAAHFDLGRETTLHGALEDAILCGRCYAHLTQGAPAHAH